MHFMPTTERKIYRLGAPINFPTTFEEATELLEWAIGELHERTHIAANGPDACTALDNTNSNYCRTRLALRDPRFTCEDKWHLVYQAGEGPCPTCGNGWIAPADPK